MTPEQASRVQMGDLVSCGDKMLVVRSITTKQIAGPHFRLEDGDLVSYRLCGLPPFLMGKAAERHGVSPAKETITTDGWYELQDGSFAKMEHVQPDGYSARVLLVTAWSANGHGMNAYDETAPEDAIYTHGSPLKP